MLDGARNWATNWGNLASVASLVVTIVGFGVGLWKLRKQQAAVDAARHAVDQAMAAIAERYVAASLAEIRWAASDFVHACRNEEWERASFAADRVRGLLLPVLESDMLTTTERERMTVARDDVRIIRDRVHDLKGTNKKLSKVNLKSLDEIQEEVDRVYARRAALNLPRGGV